MNTIVTKTKSRNLVNHCLGILGILQPRKKIFEERIVNLAALWMILHTEGKGIIAEPDLLNDVIDEAPRFNCEPLA